MSRIQIYSLDEEQHQAGEAEVSFEMTTVWNTCCRADTDISWDSWRCYL